MTFREFLAAVAEESKNTYRPDCVNSSIYRLQVDDKLVLEIINDLDRIDCLRGVVAEKKLERVNRALGHALKGFEELQEAVR